MDFNSWRDFVSYNRDLCKDEVDQDVVSWYSGEGGAGKSMISLLLNRQYDSTFERRTIAQASRIHQFHGLGPEVEVPIGDPIAMSNLGFLKQVVGLPAEMAIQGDELNLFARSAMSAEVMALAKWLKDSRGRNLFVSLIFPDDGMVDEKLILFRARYRVHVERLPDETRVAHVYEKLPAIKRDASRPFGNWRLVMDPFTFPALDREHALNLAYRAIKKAHMDANDGELADELEAKLNAKKAKRRVGERGGARLPMGSLAWRPEWGTTLPAPPTRKAPPPSRRGEARSRSSHDAPRAREDGEVGSS